MSPSQRSADKTTDFQLSSSSGNGLVEQKFACELLSCQICASVALSCETGEKWQRNSACQLVYAPSDKCASSGLRIEDDEGHKGDTMAETDGNSPVLNGGSDKKQPGEDQHKEGDASGSKDGQTQSSTED
ncbi:hypothetical protein ILYODFUR_032430, partial [Ilyodon furcidens]